MWLQALQEIHQVSLLLISQADLKALIIEIHQLLKIGGNSVVEVRGPRGKTSQNRTFASSDIGALAGN